MKTLKCFVLLCFFLSFTVNPIKAQNRVTKEEITYDFGGRYFPCTGEYLWGDVTFHYWFMSHNCIELIRKATIYATDEFGNRNGHVYEISSNGPGLTFYEVTGTLKLDGKVISVFHMSFHTTTNANGDVVVDRSEMRFDCK
jgi:hypothetical protein